MSALSTHLQKHRGQGMRAFLTAEVYHNDCRPGGGGLGTLSRDWLQESADQGLPVVGVTIGHDRLQHQVFGPDLMQQDFFVDTQLAQNPKLVRLDHTLNLTMQGRNIPISVWGEIIQGREGVVPLFLLNSADCGAMGFERLTNRVYPGKEDPFATLGQEIILGLGGVSLLRELGVPVGMYHLNDGHPAFAAVQVLLDMGVRPETMNEARLAELRAKVRYTSHTLVGAAADFFHANIVGDMIHDPNLLKMIGLLGAYPVDGRLVGHDDPKVRNAIDMTGLSMFAAGKINAVSALNGHLLKEANPAHADRIIGGITNAIHPDWVAGPLADLFSKVAPGWESKPEELGRIEGVRKDHDFRKKLWDAHMEAKLAMITMVAENRQHIANAGLDPDIFGRDLNPGWLTIGFARRVAGYKRHNLLVKDLAALVAAVGQDRPIQFVFAGKAHPMDGNPGGGKYMLKELLEAGRELNKSYGDRIKFVFLPNYDVHIARTLIPGVDIWLNNPIWGLEASGTSTMDAIANGVLLMTTVDGCVPEMLGKGDIGWPFGIQRYRSGDGNYTGDTYSLYAALSAASDIYYHSINNGLFAKGNGSLWTDKMISTIAGVTPYFLTPRMVHQYREQVWDLA